MHFAALQNMTSVASESFDSTRSTCVDGEWSPLPVASSCFLADSAAPVFPINGDDLTEQTLGLELGLGFQPVDLCSSSSSAVSRRRFHPIPLDERHVFLCFKEPQAWPALVEAADFDRLPRFLAAAIKLKKKDMVKKVSRKTLTKVPIFDGLTWLIEVCIDGGRMLLMVFHGYDIEVCIHGFLLLERALMGTPWPSK